MVMWNANSIVQHRLTSRLTRRVETAINVKSNITDFEIPIPKQNSIEATGILPYSTPGLQGR
jgi:hypothetical protein